MNIHINTDMPLMDYIALIWFLVVWVMYSLVADRWLYQKRGIISVMHNLRRRWIELMLKRTERLVDVRIIANLMRSTTFMASTSILIVAGLMAALGYGEKAQQVIAEFPYTHEMTPHIWVVKTSVLVVIFVYSFFKLTWVMRQFNFIAVMIMATPNYAEMPPEEFDKEEKERFIEQISKLLTHSAMHFNMAVRSYYFGLIALGWYISPYLFMSLSVLVVGVLFRREFGSRTLQMLKV